MRTWKTKATTSWVSADIYDNLPTQKQSQLLSQRKRYLTIKEKRNHLGEIMTSRQQRTRGIHFRGPQANNKINVPHTAQPIKTAGQNAKSQMR